MVNLSHAGAGFNHGHKRILLTIIFSLSLAGRVMGADFYVDADSPGGNGLAWSTAKTELGDALAAASLGDTIWLDGDVFTQSTSLQAVPGVTIKGDPDNTLNPASDKYERTLANGYSLNFPVLFGGNRFDEGSWSQEDGYPVYWSSEVPASNCGVFEKRDNWTYTNYREVSTFDNCVAVPNSYWRDTGNTKFHGAGTIFVHRSDGAEPGLNDSLYYGRSGSSVILNNDDNVSFENLFLVGGCRGFQFLTARSLGVSIHNVTMKSMYAAFVDLSAGIPNDNITVSNSTFTDLTSGTAIKASSATVDLTIINNNISRIAQGKEGSQNSNAAISYRGQGRFTATGNTIHDIYGVGDTDADRFLASATQTADDKGTGIYSAPRSTAEIYIHNNTVYQCVGWGIMIQAVASWCEISNNYVHDTKRSGFYYSNSGAGLIDHNIQDTSYAGQGFVIRQPALPVDIIGNIAVNNRRLGYLFASGFITYMTPSSSGENGSMSFISNASWGNRTSAFTILDVGDGQNNDPVDKVYLYDNYGYSDTLGSKAIIVNGRDFVAQDDCSVFQNCYAFSTQGNVILDRNNWRVDGNATVLGSWMGADSGPTLGSWQSISGQDANSRSEMLADEDNDGIPDEFDNCVEVTNGFAIPDAGGNSQLDTDGDGFGNMCDGDMNGSGFVDFADLTAFSGAFFQPPGPSCCGIPLP